MSQYLSDEQQKMLDLWTELQRVRKQFVDLKESTEKDLKDQRNDFNQIIRSIQGVTKTFSSDVRSKSQFFKIYFLCRCFLKLEQMEKL